MTRRSIGFEALFDHLATNELRFSDQIEVFNGTEVELTGYLSPAHDGSARMLLVDAPGACPDCSPAPVAAVYLPGFTTKANATRAVQLTGRIAYGFEIETDGNASFLRLIDARIAPCLPLDHQCSHESSTC